MSCWVQTTTPSCWKTKTTDPRRHPATTNPRRRRRGFFVSGIREARASCIAGRVARKNPAQFSRKRTCAARNRGRPLVAPRARCVVRKRACGCVACMRACMRRCRSCCDHMRCKPRHCLHAAHRCIVVAVATDASMQRIRRASMHVDGNTAPARAKKDCDRLLTVEKTVIRFRPADVPCGSE